ncbi:hypothetical protein HW555_004949 [Spodoptera exigua]|uniref:EGF-like domain-containing protein n=1 Tax=Spodoptera exigua TaxID=7107 RepID=A0A835L7V6_SPOEX|nr:hypothetical protein HW555_004949 [Spodoptera exigua]
MCCKSYLLLIGIILHASLVQSTLIEIDICEQDSDCSSMPNLVCRAGSCVCRPGTENLFGNSCEPVAPYHASPCQLTVQCRALFMNFECRKTGDNEVGQCLCQAGHHYFSGRCWKSIDFGGKCTRSEECMGTLRDPYNLACVEGICSCAEGYYERQRGECRESSFNIDDDCLLNEDCQFPNGICDTTTFKCTTSTSSSLTKTSLPRNEDHDNQESRMMERETQSVSNNSTSLSVTSLARVHTTACNSNDGCSNGFVCTAYGYCACPRGYYANAAGTMCLAELGSPSADNQCVGFLAQVREGICKCPKNFYYNENMRDCIKATRRPTDACANDEMCHTFGGSARCGEPGQFELRSCDCIPEEAVWDADREICRLFAGIGESCEVDSDCLAGNMDILCVLDESGQGRVCSCPEGYSNIDGLCLTTGLSLGDSCQMTIECTETPHTECIDGQCSCSEGYQALEGTCASVIGGSCVEDNDCITENSICDIENNTCQCSESFVGYDYVCWPHLVNHVTPCSVTAQCLIATGEASSCENGRCECFEGYHLRLFETCSRSSECFLEDITDRVQCRNSQCQCSFEYPYSEELNTCMSSASTTVGSIFMTILALIYVKLHY